CDAGDVEENVRRGHQGARRLLRREVMRVASRDIAGVDGSLPKSIEGTSTAWVAIGESSPGGKMKV
ncbi:MAG TPA: hypothetical protein VMI74_13900, partial [Burkholderiales bacterium]|nr:hypothetical protein [Burkholderiales bacterium]